jgi:hypothetical protein
MTSSALDAFKVPRSHGKVQIFWLLESLSLSSSCDGGDGDEDERMSRQIDAPASIRAFAHARPIP